MAIALIVHTPFGGYVRGDRIEDAAKIDAVLKAGHADHVIRVAAPTPSATKEG